VKFSSSVVLNPTDPPTDKLLKVYFNSPYTYRRKDDITRTFLLRCAYLVEIASIVLAGGVLPNGH
jgi:hypothetical protein